MDYNIDFNNPEIISQLIKTMVENTPVAYIVLDKDYRVHYINDNFLQLRKLSAADVMGIRCFDISNKGVPCEVCAVRRTIATGKRHEVMRKDVLPDGTVRYIDDKSIPLYKDDEGNFDYILEIMINRSPIMQLREDANKMFYNIVKMLISVLDKKDPYTSTHSSDVSAISVKLAKFIGLGEDEIYQISLGALLHDIGKVHIPDYIINKTSQLDNDEYMKIKHHPVESFDILKDLEGFNEIKEICLRHHERWDGAGYPGRLKEAQTPLGAYIVGLADTYDAMTSDRSYRKGMTHEKAIEEIKRNIGTQFHPRVGSQFVEMCTNYFTTRASLIAKDDHAIDEYLSRKKDANQVIRTISAPSRTEPAAPQEKLLKDFKFDEQLISLIYKYTPAYYTIISQSFDILYASDSLAKALDCPDAKMLTGGKCFEVNNKNMSCFKVKDSVMACPVVRAFHSGKEQTGTSIESFNGQTKYFDIYAVPIEVKNRNNENVTCVMEIMFDRTDEVLLQMQLEKDIKTLILTLENLINKLEPEETVNAEAITNECDGFGEFIARFNDELQQKYGEL